MKKAFGVLAFGTALLGSTVLSGSAAIAGQNDDLVARLNAADQENAALRKQASDLATAKPSASPGFAANFADKISDFMGSYAADLPVAYKAPPPREPGRFTFWGEGGAIWTGGDRVADPFTLNDFTTVGFGGNNCVSAPGQFGVCTLTAPSSNAGIVPNSGSIPGIFDLNPKIGWEAATGFDYKFANSPWHVSGQFRYGEGGKTSGAAASSGTLDPTLLTLIQADDSQGCFSPIAGSHFPNFTRDLPGPAIELPFPISACGGSQSLGVSYSETHWLSDLALGYDIAGHGGTYVQVKGGLRIEEFVATTTTVTSQTNFVNFTNPVQLFFGPSPPNPRFSSFSMSQLGSSTDRANFIGAGPLIGLEGSARFLGAWSFDFKGDLAVLFGTQADFYQEISTTTPSTILLGLSNSNFTASGFANTFSDRRFVTMLSPDIQVGFGYWITPNVKLAASYRVDALIAVKNQKSADANGLEMPQRYWHGPRLTLTGQFDSN